MEKRPELKENKEGEINDEMSLGYYSNHEIWIDERTLDYKDGRCFECQHFALDEKFIWTQEAASLLNKSPTTIRRWIRKGKLKARKYEGCLSVDIVGYQILTLPFKVYLIERESVNNLKKPEMT